MKLKYITTPLVCLMAASCASVPSSSDTPALPPADIATPVSEPGSARPQGGVRPIPPESMIAQACDIKGAIDWMAGQKIIYSRSPAEEWRDCSGNFLRLSSYIASQCPGVEMAAPPGIKAYRHGRDNKRPGRATARTTRGLAQWYDVKGMFIPIYYDNTEPGQAPVALQEIRNKIKTGSVLWFSRRTPQSSDGKAALYNETSGAINHMGTVVDVTRDSAGNVVEWTMYHGQNERKNNEITTHWWNWPAAYTSRGQTYPPGGYWSQRIVGFAGSLIPSARIRLSENTNQ